MEILDVLLDALLDTLKLLPWLLIIYIAIELIEHKTRLTGSNNRLNGKLGPLIGAATGLIPQCGFSVMAAKLFEQKYITVGTLLAIFLATSDEAFIILLSSGSGAVWLLPLIVLKIFVGVLAGYAADAIVKAVSGRRKPVSSSGEALDAARAAKAGCGAEILGAEADHAHGACGHDHDHEDDHDHDHDHHDHHDREPELGHGARELFLKKAEEHEFECTSCGRVHDEKRPFRTYFLSPALHTLKVALFILAVNVILGLIIHAVSEEKFAAFMNRNLVAQPFITSLVGLIPNCASSVVITQSFLQGGIAFGSCAAGLCANAGLGFVVLLKNLREWKRNLALIGVCYLISVLVGLATNAVFAAL